MNEIRVVTDLLSENEFFARICVYARLEIHESSVVKVPGLYTYEVGNEQGSRSEWDVFDYEF